MRLAAGLLELGELLLEARNRLLAAGAVAVGLAGVARDDEALARGAVADDHLLDGDVVGDDVVAALALERQPGLRGPGAQLHPGDVVAAGALEVAQVLAA